MAPHALLVQALVAQLRGTWQILCLSTDSFDGPLLVSFFHPLKSIMEEKAHDNAID
jgi:hypothetical protein